MEGREGAKMPLKPGTVVVLHSMNTEGFNRHVATVVDSPSLVEPRVVVQIQGTEKKIKVRPECCRPAQKPRTEDDLQSGLSAAAVSCVLRKASPTTFIPEVLHHVFRTLRISSVSMKEVAVASVSSEAVPHPLSAYTYKAECTLEPGHDSCWISRGGHERPEWIVYRLGPEPRRVDYVRMAIPTMPAGPLSVRRFHLCTSNAAEGPWDGLAEHHFTTLDEEGLQEFAVAPPIEARFIRLVCTENAAEDDVALLSSLHFHQGVDPIGFWQISFT